MRFPGESGDNCLPAASTFRVLGLVILGNKRQLGGQRVPSVCDTCRGQRRFTGARGGCPPPLFAPTCLDVGIAETAHSVHSASPHFHFNLNLMNAKTLAEN
uniref:Uncharacterized protein n=1 Tax=Knipowitschia caucasica TaxID=637954 RepID=A0AAV2K259_KNICA